MLCEFSRDDLSSLRILLAGGMGGTACWTVAIAPDVLKSRYQSAPEGLYPRGIRDVYRDIVSPWMCCWKCSMSIPRYTPDGQLLLHADAQ